MKIGTPVGFSIFFETSIFAAVTLLMSAFDTATIAAGVSLASGGNPDSRTAKEYYEVLAAADKAADSTGFIEFMLRIIRDALRELIQTEQVREQVTEQVERLLMALGNETLSAKELLDRLRLKHRPTFSNNYLRPALELGLIEMTVPDKPNSSRQKYRIKQIT